jgi:hypothetical protein
VNAPRDAEVAGERLERRTLRPLAEHDERGVGRQRRERPHRDVEPLLLGQPRDRQQDARLVRQPARRVLAPRLGQLVQAVVDRRHLPGGQPDLVDREPPQRLRDRHDPRRQPAEPALDVAERPEPERVVVVLRRDERRSPQRRRHAAVDVRVDEVRVHDVGAQRPHEPRQQQRIEVARRRHPDRRNRERPVERRRIECRVVEPDEERLDPALGERRQERQQVPLRA